MALSAMRNLNGYELNGRALRVDNAASEKSKEELKNLQASLGGPPVESPYGAEVSPDKAPEAISRVIASLPPEQLYELMTQMKACIENNPNEARTLLIQNPQLAYALLQAQVAMKIIEPKMAMGMLHGSNGLPTGLLPTPGVTQGPPVSNSQVLEIPPPLPVNEISLAFSTASSTPSTTIPPVNVPRTTVIPPSKPSLLGDKPPVMVSPPQVPNTTNPFPERADSHVMGDQDLRPPLLTDRDMRQPPLPPMMAGDKDMRHLPMGDQDFRSLNIPPGLPEIKPFDDPRFRNIPGPDMVARNNGSTFDRPRPGMPLDGRPGPRLPPDGRPGPGLPPDGRPGPGLPPDGRPGPGLPPDGRPGPGLPPDRRPCPGLPPDGRFGARLPSVGRAGPGLPPDGRTAPGLPPDGRPGFDGRGVAGMSPRMEDPRNIVPSILNVSPGCATPQNPRMAIANSEPSIGGASPNAVSSPRPGNNSFIAAAKAIAPHDQQKAALIMQVLQLSEQQIAMLQPEQRQNIMILKEQIAHSQLT